MASFLQNNGDIILDAVLTDYGRRMLAKGDGSFNIVKFAFGDDEIDYGNYNPDAPSMTEDIVIMNTPILEAMTNNTATMKHTLLTLTRENILYMPVMKLNADGKVTTSKIGSFGNPTVFTGFVVPVDSINNPTLNALSSSTSVGVTIPGVIKKDNTNIVIDQGLDSLDLDPTKNLLDVDPMLYESEYNIYVDNRFCSVANLAHQRIMPMGVDDDGIAVYKVSQQSNLNNFQYVKKITVDTTNFATSDSEIAGTQGSRLQFSIIPSNNLISSDYYFDKYGSTAYLNYDNQPTKEFKILRMPVRVTGVNTGYTIDVPVLFAKVIP